MGFLPPKTLDKSLFGGVKETNTASFEVRYGQKF